MKFGEKRVKELLAVRARAGTENLTAKEQARLDFEKWLHPEDIRRQRE